jgi:endonuclease G
MKKILFILTILIWNPIFSQSDTFVIRQSFEVLYSQKKKQPLTLTYNVENVPCAATRQGMDFYPEKGIITSNDIDYAKNEWDKGHYAPAASFCGSRDLIHSTFSYLNCALQHYKLNRGPWKELEAQERIWAKEGKVIIKIQTIYDNNPNLSPGGADIPDGFIKTVTLTKTGEVKKYYFPNKECSGNFEQFRIKN